MDKTMNQHILQGKWKEIRGGLKKQWGKLTDDDVRRIEGSLDQVVGILQQRYGYTKDRAEKEIEQYLSTYHDYVDEYGNKLHDYNQEMQSKVRSALSQASGKLHREPSTKEKLAKKKGKGWLAIVAGLTLFAVVFYLFNKQENKSFTGSSGNTGSSHIGNSGQPGRPY
jgi:uncharacterized protein YjbJ (UPF0337 family)